MIASADAGTIDAAPSRDVAALYVDVAAGNLIASADAGTIAVAAGGELAVALRAARDGERRARRHMDAGIVTMESLHRVLRAVLQDDGGVAQAVEARPLVIFVVITDDDHAVQRHRGVGGNADLHVGTEPARDGHAVGGGGKLSGRFSRQLREVAVPCVRLGVGRGGDALHLQSSVVLQCHLLAALELLDGQVDVGLCVVHVTLPAVGVLGVVGQADGVGRHGLHQANRVTHAGAVGNRRIESVWFKAQKGGSGIVRRRRPIAAFVAGIDHQSRI